MWPFLAALGFMVVLLVVLGLSLFFRPAEDRVSDDTRVQYAINDNYTARNALDYEAFRASSCEADLADDEFPSEQEFLAEHERSREDNGQINIPLISDLVVEGQRATAKVHWHYEERPDDETVTEVVVIEENGDWKVCGS